MLYLQEHVFARVLRKEKILARQYLDMIHILSKCCLDFVYTLSRYCVDIV